MPKISVCIPVYGVEKYIERCARSLFEQTMTDGIEFIFVNDCTKDRSIEILENVLTEYPARQKQTRIIHHKKNSGLMAARNTALQYASGDYIIHCDSDDWVDLNFYESMYKKAVETNADVICASIVWEYEDIKKKAKKITPVITNNISDYIQKNKGGHLNSLWSKLYKKAIALNPTVSCPDSICMGEDLLRNIQMLDKCKNIAFAADVYYHYWQNYTSVTHNFTETHFFSLKKVLDILQEYYYDKYYSICQQVKETILLSSLRNLYKNNKLLSLFYEIWENTSLKEKIEIIVYSKHNLKSKLAIISACFSKTFTIFILKHFFK